MFSCSLKPLGGPHYFYAQVNYQYPYFSCLKWDNAINKIVKHQSQDLAVLF